MSSTYKQLLCVDLHCIFLCIHVISQKVIFECPMYSLIKEKKLLKVLGASDWVFHLLFGKNIGTFSIGNGSEIRPQKQPWKIPVDLGDMTFGQGYDTSLGHGQQLCEILSRSNKGVRSYCPDTMWRQTVVQPIFSGQGLQTTGFSGRLFGVPVLMHI